MLRKTLFLLFVAASLIMQAQTADDIIAKHFAATGGVDKWSKVTSIKFTGNYELGPGMQAPVTEISLNAPFLGHYSEFSWQGMTSREAMRGDSGWNYNPFRGKREADPKSANEIRSDKLTANPQGLLLNYKQNGYQVDYLGTDDMDGSDVYKLRLTTKDGDMIYYYFDAETYYLLRMDTRIRFKDKEEKNYVVFSDFRKTDYGIVVPFSRQQIDENGSEQGGPVNFTKAEVNAPVDMALFKVPGN